MKDKNLFIHPLFIVLGIVMFFCGNGILFLIYLSTIILHELGHYVVALRLGYKLNNFCLLPQGVMLFGKQQFFSYNDEIKIAMAGPLVNIVLTISTVALWWIFPITYAYMETFAFCNIITAMFNFLPILPLDGGRIFVAMFSKSHKRKSAIKFCNIFGMVVSSVFVVLFFISFFNEYNFTYLVVAIFLIVGILTPSKTQIYVNGFSKEVKRKKLENGLKIKSTLIFENAQLSKLVPLLSNHNYNIVYVANEYMEIVGVLHECDLEGLLEKFEITEQIKNVI